MAFIKYVDFNSIPEKYRVSDRDFILAISGINPALMKAHFDFYIALMIKKGPLKRWFREAIGVFVSVLNNCVY